MAACNEPAETALRANTLLLSARVLAAKLDDVATHIDEPEDEAVVVDGPFDAHGSPLWELGAFMPQSRAAMLVGHCVDPQPGERVLDLCAAPGGKTTHLAALMRRRGEIVAVERHAGRAQALRDTCARMQASNVSVVVADATTVAGEGHEIAAGSFDRVLVDPPCSGLGTLQARPDIRWRASPETIEQLTREQAAILAAAARAVRNGGVLVYSTCTISPAENELLVRAFLREHPQFSADDLSARLPGHAHPTAGEFMLTLPTRDRTAGFFMARLRRDGGQG
jgi:16S rRNA (cytosine967-C5)-methyltransferase